MTRADDRPSDEPTRRRILGEAGVGLAGLAGVGASTGAIGVGGTTSESNATARATQNVAVDEQPLLDAHTHLIPEATMDREPLEAAELVVWMDDNGIDRAVVHALDSPEAYPVQAPSWWVLEQVEPYPDRLIPFCTVDPRTLVYEADFGAVTALFERYLEQGMQGFGELKPGLPVDDSRLHWLYERCADDGLPILFHMDDKAMLDDVGLPRLEDVLASYPEVDFLAHAHAWWAHISADVGPDDRGAYPTGPVEPGGRVPELLSTYDNVYGDLSAGSGWNALTRDPAYAQGFLEDHHEQLLFGTDYLAPGQEVPQFELFERFDLSEDAWANIRYRNLEGVLE
ncbi:amidohydrolase family protein [Natronolimnohabitans sp. A-GB9]|uniref:amidohydrolase family protein n=1 Tax=Natronolimnohabitans sp. A-GB9 TaxID=3069757 RepID=UPI0027AE8F09|nr:amidohydrolase family protein [Natronolimnohabitans sp. A-GB9]MDQ2051207.1 amidohydrolase family protein [Natronolimnohabitans sp. A-GB9]